MCHFKFHLANYSINQYASMAEILTQQKSCNTKCIKLLSQEPKNIKEIEDNENEQLIKANQLNEISEEEDLEKTEDEAVKKNADKIIKDVL